MPPPVCLVVLIGVPGVGKTRLCQFLVEHLTSSSVYLYHVCYDDCEADLSADLYKNFRTNVYNKVENIITDIVNNKDVNEYYLLIDDNMYYRSMRRAYFNLARQFQISFCQIYVTCPLDVALERNNQRDCPISPSVVSNMFEKLEIPSRINWETYSITVSSESPFNLEAICALLKESLLNPVLQKDNTVCYNHESFIHTIDLLLRKIINNLIQEHGTNKPAKSQEYSVKKKFIISSLKNNELFLPELQHDELVKYLKNIICNVK